jgi:DNA-nicking Smr family endonuclease
MLLPSSRAEAEFDLHGMEVAEAERSAERFIRAQRTAGRRVLRVITGRGAQGGKAPIRTRVRTLLKRLQQEGIVGEFELEATDGSFLLEVMR